MTTLLVILIALTILLVAVLCFQPRLTVASGGKMLAFIALFVMPISVVWTGTDHHLERSKQTQFCVSCHVMKPFRRSLDIKDLGEEATDYYLPAVHWQKRLVPREHACYTCHTTYTMFGDLKAKLNGLKHIWIYYFGEVPEDIELYEPYKNRECLHCHEGARSFVEQIAHSSMMDQISTGEVSCLECHQRTHPVDSLEGVDMWRPEEGR